MSQNAGTLRSQHRQQITPRGPAEECSFQLPVQLFRAVFEVNRQWRAVALETQSSWRLLLSVDPIPGSRGAGSVYVCASEGQTTRMLDRAGLIKNLEVIFVLGLKKGDTPTPERRASLYNTLGHSALHNISFLCIIINPEMTLSLVNAARDDVFHGELPCLESLTIACAQAIGDLYEPLNALMDIIEASSEKLKSLYLENVNKDFILGASTKKFWTRLIRITIRNDFDSLDAQLFFLPLSLEFFSFSGELVATPAPFTAHLDSALQAKIELPELKWLRVSLISTGTLARLNLPNLQIMSIDRLQWEYPNLDTLENVDRAIDKQQASVDLTPIGDSNKLERLDVLGGLLMRRFEIQGTLEDLDRAIKNQQAVVDLTLAGDENRLKRLDVLGGLLMRRFEIQGTLEDLDRAIKNQQAVVDLTLAGDDNRLKRLDVLGVMLTRRFEIQGTLEDLDRAIKNQQAVLDFTLAGDDNRLKRLDVLGVMLTRRFEIQGALEDLDGAIWIYRAGAVLTPVDDERKPERLIYLESLLERRLKTVGDSNSEIWPSLRASVTVPTILGGIKGIYETVKDKLVEDLQQLSICIRKSKRGELATNLRRMENAILCLKFQDGDKLCQDVFKASTRLGAYCQALRNRAEDKTDYLELEDLYKEFVRIEREFSAAHDRISSKYEQLYKQWRAERQSISKFLSKADLNKSQGNNQEIRALVEQVDAGFEKMGNVLKNEANDLKNLSETLNGLSKLVHLSPDPPIASNDPAQISAQPPDPPPTTEVSPQVDNVIETLSQVDALVEKSRYTKAREIVSKTSSKTKQKLRKLRTSSEDYDEESRTLSCLQTHHQNDHSRDIWNRQRELCNQLSKLVKGMRRMLKGIEKEFNGCKASIQGLVFGPLGDLLCDLEPYMSQAGLEVSRKGLHPDLILYEAAFQAIADSIPAQSALLGSIKRCLSVVDKLRGV